MRGTIDRAERAEKAEKAERAEKPEKTKSVGHGKDTATSVTD
jgi:hypothetical protein